jgi:hypothetical protein
MLVFIDESGDTGLKLDGRSSSNLIVTLVLFDDRAQAEAADKRIAELKGELGLHPDFEFHFRKLRHDWRERFLRELGAFEFFYFSVVLKKAELSEKGLQNPAALYRYTCSLVFESAKPHLREAIVVMDGTGSQQFRRELASYLRKKVNEPGDGTKFISKVKLQDSHKNTLLQLADMVCGAVARSFTEKADAKSYRKLISHREMEVALWPK